MSQMNINDAMDIVDGWGPDPQLWPTKHRDTLEDMLRSDDDFAAYVADVKRIEDLLANWDQADDGAGINWDDLEDEDNEPKSDKQDKLDRDEPDQDDSDDEEDAERETSEGDEDGDDEEESDEGEDGDISWPEEEEQEEDEGVGFPGFAGAGQDRNDDHGQVEIDPEALKDMDQMFQDFIRDQIETTDTSEFRVFTRDFDEIVDLNAPDDTPLDRIDQAVALSTGALQKDLRRLIAAQSQAKRIPGKRSGRLHAPNLHRVLSGDDRVFTRREEAPTLDTAISLVLDNSGSMMGSRMKLAAESAYAIGSVLHRLGVAFECLGFTDNTCDPRCQTAEYQRQVDEAHAIAPLVRTTPIIMPKFKLFEERWLQPVQRRFAYVYNHDGGYTPQGAVVPFGSTPEGCGVQFAARRLLARKEKRKIMIVMTDGEPGGQQHDWSGGQPYKKQARDTVRSVMASGIDLVGIGIQHNGPKGYYPNAMVINNLSEMPAQLMALLKKFMLGK